MPHKLLLADDSVTIQRVIELTFADEDIKVLAVGDGQQAVDRIESDPPDIILADVGMPKRNGYEVASYVKSQPRLAHIPVVLLTGAFEPVDQARAAAAGCDAVLAKPFEPLLVISRVKELLGAREKAAARALISTPASHVADAAGTLGEAESRLRPGHPTASGVLGTPRAALETSLRWSADRTGPDEGMIDSMRPAVRTTDPKVSLDDYFDQLDAAFSKLGDARESPPSVPDRTSAPPSDSDFSWLQEVPLGKPKSEERPKASDAFDFSGVTGIEAGPGDSNQRREQPEAAQPVAEPDAGHLATDEPPNAAASTQAVSFPPIADTFEALLAAELGELPGPASVALPSPSAAAAAVPAAIVDQVAMKVLQQLSDKVVRETVVQVVTQVAERLVREEIERIRAGKG